MITQLRSTGWLIVACLFTLSMGGCSGDGDAGTDNEVRTSIPSIVEAVGPERTAKPVRVADPSNTLPGELNREAIQQIQAYKDLPVVWLGERFNDLQLVAFVPQITNVPPGLPWSGGRSRVNTTGLVYGDMRAEAGRR